MTLDVRPFDDGDIEAAGRLLAARHAEHRRHEPLLAARFENDEAAAAEVAAIWSTERASGAVALEDRRAVGYLLGVPKTDPTWGPNAWAESAGVAVQVAETPRDLNAVAAARWVDEGRLAHCVLLPSHDTALVDAFSGSGSGSSRSTPSVHHWPTSLTRPYGRRATTTPPCSPPSISSCRLIRAAPPSSPAGRPRPMRRRSPKPRKPSTTRTSRPSSWNATVAWSGRQLVAR